MNRSTKNPSHERDPPPTSPSYPKKRHRDDVIISSSTPGKRPKFDSYLEIPNLPPKIHRICEVIANTPPPSVEKVLDETGIRVSQEDVEHVLKLSYGYPSCAVKFFRWAGHQLHDTHSPYAWNLVVDMLGKNSLFDAMWDAVKSMRKAGLLSLATFASVFGSYVVSERVDEAFMTFEVMDQYGVGKDIVALNSLLSAICRDGQTERAEEFMRVVKDRIRPDGDTYAILLEGWEREGNVDGARRSFGEMVNEVGWDPVNVAAYDSFLCTLVKGMKGFHEALKCLNTMKERGCLPGVKFFGFALEDCVMKNDARGAALLWEAMTVRSDFRPDVHMYNMMISLHCQLSNCDIATRYLDEMVYHGVFPDSESYNILLHCFLKNRMVDDVSSTFTEMVKNECMPSQKNCFGALRVCLVLGDPYMAIKIWKYMLENYTCDLREMGNVLISGLSDRNRVQEAVKYAYDMIDRRIKLSNSSLAKLKQSLNKVGKGRVYDELLKKWKFGRPV